MLATHKTLLERIALLKIWLGNGQAYFNDFKYPVILAIGLKVYLPDASLLALSLVVVGIVVFLIIVGWLDMSFLRLHQKVAEISTERYNPYFEKLGKKLKRNR